MNTQDKIELPPLPPADRHFEFDSHRMKASIDIPYWGEKSLEAYARAAIEADRKRTAELLKNPVHVHSNMCRGIIAPITFDMLAHVLGEEATNEWLRKRRGEPVAWRYLTPTGWHATTDAARALGVAEHHTVEPLFAAPQPAEPVKVPSDEELKALAISVKEPGPDGFILRYARALLARYGQTPDPTHKSSNQNQLKG